ncbi:MAG: cadherin-like beta sandwich domain-containing protein [Lachnospiraceae bacterium]|nr:cadherin-like beta sandwich domain-containing protein [Lachnospiraceae bacterium]
MSQGANTKENPQLEMLEINPGGISFQPDVYEYTVQVAEDVTKILVKGKAKAGHTYTINGNSNLSPGVNEVTVTVTGEDYEQTVYRIRVLVGEGKETETVTLTENQTDGQPQETAAVTESAASTESFLHHITTGTNRYITIGIGVCAALSVVLWISFLIKRMLVKRQRERLKAAREEKRRQTKERVEMARKQEEELLLQIERLTQKSRTMKTTDQDGLRIIQLDESDHENDESSQQDEWYDDYDEYDDYDDDYEYDDEEN